jgi:DNA polymerase III epsilon subunit family exonuclease
MLSFDLSKPWRDLSFVAIDVETTGLEIDTCRVIEVGIVRYERGQVAERWGSLIDPGVPIPDKVVEVTGITDDMVQGQPKFRELKWDIYGRLRDRLLVAYNADFDTGFISNELQRVGLTMPSVPVLDPLVWARRLMPNQRRHNLGAVCDKLGVSLENAHRAVDDAEAAGKVLLRFADKVAINLGDLLDEQKEWKDVQEAAFAERRAAREAKKAAKDAAKAAAMAEAEDESAKNQAGLFG